MKHTAQFTFNIGITVIKQQVSYRYCLKPLPADSYARSCSDHCGRRVGFADRGQHVGRGQGTTKAAHQLLQVSNVVFHVLFIIEN
jgi:hypothetical protein